MDELTEAMSYTKDIVDVAMPNDNVRRRGSAWIISNANFSIKTSDMKDSKGNPTGYLFFSIPISAGSLHTNWLNRQTLEKRAALK